MASFPALKSGSAAMYPLTRSIECSTQVVQFCDDSEQRWKSRAKVSGFVLEYTDISGYDLGILRDFFRTVKGRGDTTWDVTIGGVLYQYMMFDSDEFTFTETRPNRFTVRLSCKQWRKN